MKFPEIKSADYWMQAKWELSPAQRLHNRLSRASMHLMNRVEQIIRKDWEPYEDYGVYGLMDRTRGNINRRRDIAAVASIRASINARLRGPGNAIV